MRDRDIQALNAALADAVRHAAPRDAWSEASVDALDLLAVAAGDKRIAVLGCDGTDPGWLSALDPRLLAYGITFVRAPLWRVDAEFAGLPQWYAEPTIAARRRLQVLYIGAPAAVNAFVTDLAITLDVEAACLGYPICCVTAYHDRRRRVHALTIEAIRHFAGPEEDRMRRFAAAEVALQPPSEEARAEYREALDCALAPYTSICMCADCRADLNGPAWRISRARAALARRGGLHELIPMASLDAA